MSKKNDDVLLWSHYSEEHRGVCLGFELTLDPDTFDGFDVRYIKDCRAVDYFINRRKAFNHLNLTKVDRCMAQYEVILFKDPSLDILVRHHPDIDRIKYIEYNGDDGGMAVNEVVEDESFALKIAGRHWDNMMKKIYSDGYKHTAEDLIFQVTNKHLLDIVLQDGHPYKKILVKKVSE